jgi:zinc protease
VAARHITVADPKVEQPTLQRLYLVPSCRNATDRDCYALELLAEVIGGGPTSFLYRKLVLERGVAVNAGAWYMSSAMEDTRFCVYAVPAQGVSLQDLEKVVDEVLKTIPDEALDADAIERAKTRLVAETIYSTDSQSSLARIYGSALAIGETIEEVRRWPSEIESVLAADLATVAERYLVLRRSVTGYLQKSA